MPKKPQKIRNPPNLAQIPRESIRKWVQCISRPRKPYDSHQNFDSEQRFLIYLSAIGYSKDKDEDKKVCTLLHVAGAEAVEFFNTIPDGHQKSLDEVLKCFEDHCCPTKNETVERYCFNCRNRLEGETVQTYLTKLRTLARTCEFGVLRDSLIRDRLVCGIRSDPLREKLLSELPLVKAIAILTSSDLAKESSTVIKESSEEVGIKIKEEDVNIDAVGARGYTPFGRGQPFKSSQRYRSSGSSFRAQYRGYGQFRGQGRQYQSNNRCPQCGYEDHEGRRCPAEDKDCDTCGKRGHFARMRFRRQRVQVHPVEMQPGSHGEVLGDIGMDSLEIHQVGQRQGGRKDWMAKTGWQ